MIHIYSDKFNFSESIVPLSNMEVVDCNTLKSVEGEAYFKMTKSSSKSLFNGLDMGGSQFSSKLYSMDSRLWKDLLTKKLADPLVDKFRKNNSAVLVDENVVSIIPEGGSNLKFLVEMLNSYYNTEGIFCEYSYDPLGMFIFKATCKESNSGIIVRVYIDSMWITVNQFYVDEVGLTVVAPYTLVDKKLSEDVVFDLDKTVCLDFSCFDDSVRNEYLSGLSIRMSIDELDWYANKVLGVKIKKGLEIDPYQLAAERGYSESITNKLVRLTNAIYNNPHEPVVYYSSYLKRAVTMSPVTYGVMAELVDALVKEGHADLSHLIAIYDTIARHKSHYQQLNA